MGKLSKFMFFGLVDKKINKKIFYKPFNDLLDYITKIDDLVDHIENDNMNIYGKYKKTLMTDAE
jgi:cobalamin biosynthesis protein CobT